MSLRFARTLAQAFPQDHAGFLEGPTKKERQAVIATRVLMVLAIGGIILVAVLEALK